MSRVLRYVVYAAVVAGVNLVGYGLMKATTLDSQRMMEVSNCTTVARPDRRVAIDHAHFRSFPLAPPPEADPG